MILHSTDDKKSCERHVVSQQHAQFQLALPVVLFYFLWGILRTPGTAASASHSRQVSITNGDLRHDDTGRRQRQRGAATNG